jgi:hypothetical protein
MDPNAGQTPEQRLRFWVRELGLYAVTALFLAFSPLFRDHWIVVQGISWFLSLAIVARIIDVVTASAVEAAPIKAPELVQSFGFRSAALAAGSYTVLVLIMLGPFALSSGMGYETGFSYYSEKSTWLTGFVDIGDPMRPFTNVFYHISYLLGVIVGVPGSFAPFQMVYGALWWARGLLVFLILRRILGGYDFFCYLAGVVVLVHASDHALQWVGQLNQFGYIFWLLLGVYFYLRAEDSNSRPSVVFTWISAACACQFFCLWSYESGLAIILLIPPLVLLVRRRVRTRLFLLFGGWYAVAGIYLYLTLQKYLHGGSTTYQASVMRSDFRLPALMGDLLFNVKNSLLYWAAQESVGPLDMPRQSMTWLAIVAAIAAIAGGLVLAKWRQREAESGRLAPDRKVAWLLAAGVLLLAASFPAYLLLNSARSLWRTQFLSGIGTAIVLTSIAALIFNRAGKRWLRDGCCLCAIGVLAFLGARRAEELGSMHRAVWERQRKVVAQLIRAVPQVKPGTLVFLRDIPRPDDPFGDTMWFDMALRLSYPGTEVSGAYFYTDNTPAPGSTFHIYEDEWLWEKKGYPPLIREAEISDALIIDYAGGKMQIVEKIPPDMCAEACEMSDYHPESRIIHGKPSARAINRYGPM